MPNIAFGRKKFWEPLQSYNNYQLSVLWVSRKFEITAQSGTSSSQSGRNIFCSQDFRCSQLSQVAIQGRFDRQMEPTSHDPFATLAAYGCGRTGCTRHKLAWDAFRARPVAA